MSNDERTIQFRLVVAKNNEIVEGPDGADTVATISLADADLDPSVAFMRGKLRSPVRQDRFSMRCHRVRLDASSTTSSVAHRVSDHDFSVAVRRSGLRVQDLIASRKAR